MMNDQVKKVAMGGVCSTNGGEDECMYDIGGKARRDDWEDQDVGGRTISK
jgi:hypothetical protein